MLKTILAISGKPGLYKLVSQGNKMLIVETLDNQKKRMPAYATEKVVSLADISIYTDDGEEVSLPSVLQSAKEKYEGKTVDLDPKKAASDDIKAFMVNVLPNYDTDRVHVSDMRKLLQWYNLLIVAGETDFEEEKADEADVPAAQEAESK